MATSQNRWPVHTSSAQMKPLRWVTGRVHPDAHAIFDALGLLFNELVEPIRKADSWGYAYRAIRGKSSGYSNHASGTAVDFNATTHPLGRRNTFSAALRAAIRKIVAMFKGAIRWGGDYAGRPDDMHFELNTPPGSALFKAAVEVAKRILREGASAINKPADTGGFKAVTPATPNPTPQPTPKEEDVPTTTKETRFEIKHEGPGPGRDGWSAPIAILPKTDRPVSIDVHAKFGTDGDQGTGLRGEIRVFDPAKGRWTNYGAGALSPGKADLSEGAELVTAGQEVNLSIWSDRPATIAGRAFVRVEER